MPNRTRVQTRKGIHEETPRQGIWDQELSDEEVSCYPVSPSQVFQMSNQNYHPVSPWVSTRELKKFLEEINPGDAVEFRRGRFWPVYIFGYEHWSVYIGYREVRGKFGHWIIHRTSPPNTTSGDVFFGSQSINKNEHGLGNVDINDIKDAMGDSYVRINNSMDSQVRPFSQDIIIQRALNALEESHPEYHWWTNNCEHFVHYIRNGIMKCGQVDSVKTVIFWCVVAIAIAYIIYQVLEPQPNTVDPA